MFQKDYLMRMIEQFAMILMNIVLHKHMKRYDQARQEINNAYRHLLNSEPDQIKKRSADKISEMLKYGGRAAAEKLLVAAELLREEAEIDESENGFNDDIFHLLCKSFFLYIEAIQYNDDYIKKEYLEKIDTIIKKITQYELPDKIKFKLYQYNELIGRFDKAEDVLYELIEAKYDNILTEGKAFYARLESLPDSKLSNGNLPRSEVMEGLVRIEKIEND